MKKIHILATGGTISARGPAGRTAGYQDGAFRIEQLLEGVEGAAALARITGEQIFTLSSEDMTGAHWLTLARRINQLAEEGEADGFVITHGTNTLEETAYFLHLTVKTDRPVVLTGSMRPATANSADGAQNLYEAIAVAASGEARGKGVLVVFSDGIYGARGVQKVSCFRPDAFNSRDFGCLGYVQDDLPVFFQTPAEDHTLRAPFQTEGLQTLPPVEIAYFYADADPCVVPLLAGRARGLVIAGAGSGQMSIPWKEAVREAARRIPVVRCSRTGSGLVGRESRDAEAGTLWGMTLPPVKARILLSLGLTVTDSREALQEFFQTY